MLNLFTDRVFSALWQNYCLDYPLASLIYETVQTQYNLVIPWDHVAFIDLPGPHTGRIPLIELWQSLDYEVRGEGYLAEKQNPFVWLAEKNQAQRLAKQAWPQVVVADFDRAALSPTVRAIVDYYAGFAQPLDRQKLDALKKRALENEVFAKEWIVFIIDYLKGRDWPLPTVEEFCLVKQHNELLAWVLVMGRQVNHFGLAIHLIEHFSSLQAFNEWIQATLAISLNQEGGLIKGGAQQGIAQSSTAAIKKSILLANGSGELADRFIEFVWRYPKKKNENKSLLWSAYFTDFIAKQANYVVESLTLKE
jgi:Domain of unknown function (DUF1338)